MLDSANNPLTHANYHRAEVREAGERDRRPLPLEVPEYLEKRMREYLAEVSLVCVCVKLTQLQVFDLQPVACSSSQN